jgi:hypothetical protein
MEKLFDRAARHFAARATACVLALLSLQPSPGHARAQESRLGRGLGVVEIRAADGSRVRLYDHSYALLIGESEYANGWHKLDGVKRDVEAVRAALEGQGFQVTVVENADGARLESAFADFIRQYGMKKEQEQNRLLFYFAGHGFTRRQSYGEEMGYIVPTDAPNPRDDPSSFMSKAMDLEQIERYAKRIQSKHALFVFDSCFSGTLFAPTRGGVPDSIGYKTTRPVREFITSGSADETVPDKSVFREQFVAALAGEADANRDGYVTGTELGEFLQDRVINYTHGAQHPQYGKIRNPNLDKGDFVFELANAPLVASVGAPPPAAPPVSSADIEQSYWDAIKDSADANDFKAYLKKYPGGRFAEEARNNIRRLESNALAGNHDKPLVVLSSGHRSKAKTGKVTLLTPDVTSATEPGGGHPGDFRRALSQKLLNGGVPPFSLLIPTSSSDPDAITISRLRDALRKLQLGDKNAAKKIPFAVIITGDFQVKHLSPYDGLNVAEAGASLTAIDGDTGEIIAQAIIPVARGFGNTPAQAYDKALAAVVENIPASFIEKVAAAAAR